jgi:hypothetical protein
VALQSSNWRYSESTLVDESAHRLLRAYHHIVLDTEAVGAEVGLLYMGIYNVELFLKYYLTYRYRALLSPHPHAPARRGRSCRWRFLPTGGFPPQRADLLS